MPKSFRLARMLNLTLRKISVSLQKPTIPTDKTIPTVEKVDLLAYHTMGAFKWKEMGKIYPLEGVPPLSAEEFAVAKRIFAERQLPLT